MSTDQSIQYAIEQAQRLAADSEPRTPPETSGPFSISWLAKAGLYMYPWWSPSRDYQLRQFWKGSDHLAGAIYTMTSKISAIPVKIIAVDKSDRDMVEKAKQTTDILLGAAQYGAGYLTFVSKLVEDLITVDNGCFAEIIGFGDKSGPIVGRPVSVAHLDSHSCTRTGNAKYPVIFQARTGERYKLHYTRVMFASQMESPIEEMHGVGFSAVSRCINVAQTLVDILTYKQEKMGSRPVRKLIVTRGGLDPGDLKDAFALAENELDARGLSRYSRVVVVGSQALPEAGLEEFDLASMPDGFNEETSITMGMATIALALGMDARELFPALTAGATRADALLQHLKQRGKGPGQILATIENNFNFKYLPSDMRMVSDFQDDAQDRQAAEIRMVRANTRVQNNATGAVTERVMREQMVEDGDIDDSQFNRMELESGRMPDGNPVVSLFYQKKNRELSHLLDLGVQFPTDVTGNDPVMMLDSIERQRTAVYEAMASAYTDAEKWTTRSALAALDSLELMYLEPFPGATPDGEVDTTGEARQDFQVKKPVRNPNVSGHRYVDPRVRTQNSVQPRSDGLGDIGASATGEQ